MQWYFVKNGSPTGRPYSVAELAEMLRDKKIRGHRNVMYVDDESFGGTDVDGAIGLAYHELRDKSLSIKQRAYLRFMGYEGTLFLTQNECTELIEKLKNDPKIKNLTKERIFDLYIDEAERENESYILGVLQKYCNENDEPKGFLQKAEEGYHANKNHKQSMAEKAIVSLISFFLACILVMSLPVLAIYGCAVVAVSTLDGCSKTLSGFSGELADEKKPDVKKGDETIALSPQKTFVEPSFEIVSTNDNFPFSFRQEINLVGDFTNEKLESICRDSLGKYADQIIESSFMFKKGDKEYVLISFEKEKLIRFDEIEKERFEVKKKDSIKSGRVAEEGE